MTVCDGYSRGCFFARNRFMADNSGRAIAYWDGRRGGTAHTLEYCRGRGVEVINLAEQIQAFPL